MRDAVVIAAFIAGFVIYARACVWVHANRDRNRFFRVAESIRKAIAYEPN